MLTLGIDQALRGPAGLALIDPDATQPFVFGALVRFDARQPWEARVAHLATHVRALCDARMDPKFDTSVQGIAVEDTYQGKNAQTTKQLTLAAGVLWGIALERAVPFALVRHDDTDATKATLFGVHQLAPEVTGKDRVHIEDAAAIAWHAHGLLRRALRVRGL